MCNPAEQAGLDYASDTKEKNVLVSKMDNEYASIGPSKASDNHPNGNGSLIEINEVFVHLSSDSLIEADGVTDDHHSCDTSEHSAKEVLISVKDSEETIEGVELTGESSKTCIAMVDRFAEVDGTVVDGIQIPKSSHIEGVKCEEDSLQEASNRFAGVSITLNSLSDEVNGHTLKAVEAPNSISELGENDSAAEEPLIDPCKGSEKPGTQTNMGHADGTIEVNGSLMLEGLTSGSEGHCAVSCTEDKDVMMLHNSELSLDAKEQIMEFDAPLAGIDMQPGLSQGGTQQTAPTSEESSKEITAEHARSNFREANEETLRGIERQEAIVSSAHGQVINTAVLQGNNGLQLAEFLKADAVDHAPRCFNKEINAETSSEIEQGATSSKVQVTATADIEGNSPTELAEFFSSTRGSKIEEIVEQEYSPAPEKLPPKRKTFMESPRSLRMLLFSEETALMSKKDEKHKDGKVMEFSSRVVPAAESHGKDNHMEPNYPAKWYEDADDGEMSSALPGPVAYSGALTYQGLMAVPYSGSISHRSDSSASTRSFAFPILASDWNSSPVKMAAPEPRYYRQRRKGHFCFCCNRGSTLFD